MDNERLLELITVYLAKEITGGEKIELSNLLRDEKNKRIFDSTIAKWNSASRENIEFDSESGLNQLTGKLKVLDNTFSWKNRKVHNRAFEYRRNLLKIAAVLIVLLGGLSIYFNVFYNGNGTTINWNEKITAPGEKSVFRYADGTVITLNAGSKLKYPDTYGEKIREVFLEGEAYFEVAHNPSKPFIVHAGSITTTVLGTKFDVNAFPGDNEIKVSLLEGSVKVLDKNGSGNQSEIFLKPEQQFVHSNSSRSNYVRNFDLQEEVGWKDNILKFNNEQLTTVFKKLSRAYGVEFILSDTTFATRNLTANFKNASFWTVVTVIKKLSGLEYKTENKNEEVYKIIFYKNE
ncbi:MAG: FecR domain-containing protein [Ignavibacteria bacterium]|jgi:ferric-dicitrate binding protein FerR (iron transport regulator)